MDNFISFYQGLGTVTIEIICCILFFDTFFERRRFRKKWRGIAIILGLILSSYVVAVIFAKAIVLKVIFVIILLSIAMIRYFKVKLLWGGLLSIVFQGILLTIDLVFVLFIRLMGIADPNNILMIIISKMIFLGIVLIMKRKWGKKYFLGLLTDREWIRFLYIPTITIVIIFLLLFNFSNITDRSIINTLIIIAFALVLMNILVLNLTNSIVEREEKIKENEVFSERMRNFENQRKKAHEYKNHLEYIAGMIQSGNNEGALAYISEISGGIKKAVEFIDTNHTAINTILNLKYSEANEKNIVFILKINDLSRINVSDNDIVIILSNLLNNAIEACEGLDKKMIWVKLMREDQMTIISVKNTIDKKQAPSEENGRYITRKDNQEEHGIGISNIQETLKKYGGTYTIKQDAEYFKFIIMIPCEL